MEISVSWYRQTGVVFRPVSIASYIATLVALAFCLQIFGFVDSRSHSISDSLYGIFPYWAPTFLLWVWIAGRTSGKPSQ
jgi:hypothetical protein